MTKFLDPKLASSKASRKERKQTAPLQKSAATDRAVAALKRTMGNDFKKTDNQDRLRAKAINDTMPDFIAAMDEEVLAPFFFSLERLASAANRRRIATHPLRPEIVDEMHEEADEEEALAADEEALAAEEEGRAAAKAAARDGKAAKAMPQAAASDSASAS
ncbi:hypothetical protein [Palleronia sp.]|uniref:hypothetical protein n=1 Tax=Palleronia sp. TaxID=1940284 RepID=UPI0035C81993